MSTVSGWSEIRKRERVENRANGRRMARAQGRLPVDKSAFMHSLACAGSPPGSLLPCSKMLFSAIDRDTESRVSAVIAVSEGQHTAANTLSIEPCSIAPTI
eukprot:3426580-Pleurochrysis_carterae.AAC.4